MSRTQTSALSPMQKLARNPAVIAMTLALALAGCANKKNMPNSAGELGLGGAGSATPGSQQDFTVNVG
ncbi:peptidoglycan-associated lipoprotein Pal, partial [Agrobacterium sp. DKPNP3]